MFSVTSIYFIGSSESILRNFYKSALSITI